MRGLSANDHQPTGHGSARNRHSATGRDISRLALEPGLRPPAAPPPSPPRRKAGNELKPPAAFRIPRGSSQPRHPGSAPVGDLDPDHAVPRPDRDRNRLPGSTRAAMPDTIPAITAPALPRPPRKPAGQRADAGKCTLSSAPNVKPAHGPRGPCPWPVRPRGPRPWPSAQSRRSPAPLTHPTDAVRYLSVDTATQRPTALQGDTPRDREETAR
jgi:hypothetical protein